MKRLAIALCCVSVSLAFASQASASCADAKEGTLAKDCPVLFHTDTLFSFKGSSEASQFRPIAENVVPPRKVKTMHIKIQPDEGKEKTVADIATKTPTP